MALRWRVDDGPLIVVSESYLPSSNKEKRQSLTPLTKLSGSVHEYWSGSTEKSQSYEVSNHRSASEMPFKWRFAGGSMMAHFK